MRKGGRVGVFFSFFFWCVYVCIGIGGIGEELEEEEEIKQRGEGEKRRERRRKTSLFFELLGKIRCICIYLSATYQLSDSLSLVHITSRPLPST